MSDLNPVIWGPHYWFVLHTVAYNYPNQPNAVSKKKMYEFIMNFPMIIPHESISQSFTKLLDKYPVSPYLDSRQSFMKWMHFIHNQVNKSLGKDIIHYHDAMKKFHLSFESPKMTEARNEVYRKRFFYFGFIFLFVYSAYYFYDN